MERTHARGISCCIWLTLFSCEGDIEASFVQMGVYTTLLIPFIFPGRSLAYQSCMHVQLAVLNNFSCCW
jgi:hypothetical protein